MRIISINKYTITLVIETVYNMFGGIQCEAIQNDVVNWKEH